MFLNFDVFSLTLPLISDDVEVLNTWGIMLRSFWAGSLQFGVSSIYLCGLQLSSLLLGVVTVCFLAYYQLCSGWIIIWTYLKVSGAGRVWIVVENKKVWNIESKKQPTDYPSNIRTVKLLAEDSVLLYSFLKQKNILIWNTIHMVQYTNVNKSYLFHPFEGITWNRTHQNFSICRVHASSKTKNSMWLSITKAKCDFNFAGSKTEVYF